MDKKQRDIFKKAKSTIKTTYIVSLGYKVCSNKKLDIAELDEWYKSVCDMDIQYKFLDDDSCSYNICKMGSPRGSRHYYTLAIDGEDVELPQRKLRRLCRVADKKKQEQLVEQIQREIAEAKEVSVQNIIDNEMPYTCVFNGKCDARNLIFAVDEDNFSFVGGNMYVLSPLNLYRVMNMAEKKARATAKNGRSR